MPNLKYKPPISPENKENKIFNVLASLRENKQTLTKSIWQRGRAGVELCGKHPFATGLFALISLAGLILSMGGFYLDREESVVSTFQIQEITTVLIKKHQIESQTKDEQIKALTQAITNLSIGQGVLGSKEQIEAAMTALAEGNTDKAKQLFSKAAQKGEQNAQQTANTYRNLGALEFLDNTQKALKAYHRATELDPDNPSGWNQLGNLLIRVGELDQAITTYKKVLAWGVNRQDKEYISIAYNNLGLVYKTRGELDKAVEFYQKALAMNEALGYKEGMAVNYGNLGGVYHTRGELDKAIEFHQKSLAINEALRLKEGMAGDYTNLGNVYQNRGEQDHGETFLYKLILQIN